MPKISPEALNEVQKALGRYVQEVEKAPLYPSTKRTYIRHARTFVRWLDDDFEPGANVR